MEKYHLTIFKKESMLNVMKVGLKTYTCYSKAITK